MPNHPLYILRHSGRVAAYVPSLDSFSEIHSSCVDTLPKCIVDPRPLKNGSIMRYQGFFPTSCTLVITNGCNLKCDYCYEDAGNNIEIKTIPVEIAYAAIDLYVSNLTKKDKKTLNLSFFGGEPTQAFNIVQSSVAYALKAVATTNIIPNFGITTNGVCEDEIADWIAENIQRVTLSLDGNKMVHDSQRCNSYDRAARTASIIYEKIKQRMAVRVTVTKFNVGVLPELVSHLTSLFPKSRIMLEPLFRIGRGKVSWTSEPGYQEFFDAFMESLPIAKENGGRIGSSLTNLGSNRQSSFCGANGNGFLVDPEGLVFSCNRMVFALNEPVHKRFCYGKYDANSSSFSIDFTRHKWLCNLSSNSIPECKGCYAQSFCRGDCPGNKAILNPEGFHKNPSYRCEEIKKFINRYLFYKLDCAKED